MPRAQCYYEILGISETATTDEVKKAYKNLALVWHPDKNQSNLEEAHSKFQLILKAYNTLSDSREREWYDRHKDQILSDSDKADADANCLNLFQYFSSACYANYDDASDGFYTIYRDVFHKIAEEEREAMQRAARLSKNKSTTTTNTANNKPTKRDDVLDILPTFGTSESDYEGVVRPFYAYWSGFCTNLTFDNLDKYNTLEAENRRILRAMEKENSKVKATARKERNNNVRNLVEFVKKRDKRLKAHKLLVEQQNQLNRQKTAEKQRQQREKCLKEKIEYKPNAYLEMDDVERQLLEIENEYQNLKKDKRARRRRKNSDENDETADCGLGDGIDGDKQNARTGETNDDDGDDVDGLVNDDHIVDNGRGSLQVDNGGEVGAEEDQDDEEEEVEEEEEEEDSFYCAACNKEFRTINAFENHEASKKHKQSVQKLTKLLKADEVKLKNK